MIILASSSPTRLALLLNAGIDFEAIPPKIDEIRLQSQFDIQTSDKLAQHLADAKSLSISALHPQEFVIGSDQTLLCNNKFYHKPTNNAEAKQQLQELRGRTHRLTSALSCALNNEVIWRFQDEAELTMREFTDQFLEYYLDRAKDEILTSVGAYKLEGLGMQLFEEIKGDHLTILGFPLLPLLKFLRTRDLLLS